MPEPAVRPIVSAAASGVRPDPPRPDPFPATLERTTRAAAVEAGALA
jgi:hypothetical protein